MKLNSFKMAIVSPVVFCAASAYWADSTLKLDPATLHVIGEVDQRFQSYNIEMLEVTGGQFWKPYQPSQIQAANSNAAASNPAIGTAGNLYEYRPPINLENNRLRKLAAALGPVYVRLSGTWANSTYFYNADEPPPPTPPPGFKGVLTRKEWKSVVDFAKLADAELVTSFATSPGTRRADGVWTPDQARSFLAYSRSIGGRIAATEFMNEPNFAAVSRGAPAGYDAAAFGRDIAIFRPFLKETSPETLFLGPGSTGEGGPIGVAVNKVKLGSEALLQAAGPVFDVFSYHIYVAASQRCGGWKPPIGTTAEAALSEAWLSRPDSVTDFYKGLRDRFEPGKPLWVTEMADAACGGNPWASTFLDTFRYLDQHATLAQQGVSVVMHNTLVGSDYGLLDETSFTPRPNYWAALLFKALMGTTVLKPPSAPDEGLRVYAHCLKNLPGGVAILALNTNRDESRTLAVSAPSQRYTLTSSDMNMRVDLNGNPLNLQADGSIPKLASAGTSAGSITLPAASITFLAVPEAHNASCH